MTEPLTDEEVEKLKKDKDEGWRRLGLMTKSLIKLKEENAELIKAKHIYFDAWKQVFDAWKQIEEENDKLRAEKETSIYDYADLRKELDAALKRIEEMK